MDQWLIRTAKNVIAGPYTRDQVRKLILDGSLCLQDEVCEANHYWIFLHETEEVRAQLDVDVPASTKLQEEEITQTQTQTQTKTVPDVQMTPLAGPGPLLEAGATYVASMLPKLVDRNPGIESPLASQSAQLMKHEGLRQGPGPESHSKPGVRSHFAAIGEALRHSIEKSSFLRGVIVFLMIFGAFVIFAVLRLLRPPAH